jgi:hypothetical protein
MTITGLSKALCADHQEDRRCAVLQWVIAGWVVGFHRDNGRQGLRPCRESTTTSLQRESFRGM